MTMLRIGHKGADAIRVGNTLSSFAAAVDAGVDAIELDVLRPHADFADGSDWRTAPAGPVASPSGPLLVAPEPPLDRVRFDLDLKIAGREDEVVELLRERTLIDRAMASTMEIRSIEALKQLEPTLQRGWTLPRVDRDWNSRRWARPLVIVGSASLRARLPRQIAARAPELGAWAVWVYHPLITRRLVDAAPRVRVAVIAWTVDEPVRIRELVALGVDGICSNDPRLLASSREP